MKINLIGGEVRGIEALSIDAANAAVYARGEDGQVYTIPIDEIANITEEEKENG